MRGQRINSAPFGVVRLAASTAPCFAVSVRICHISVVVFAGMFAQVVHNYSSAALDSPSSYDAEERAGRVLPFFLIVPRCVSHVDGEHILDLFLLCVYSFIVMLASYSGNKSLLCLRLGVIVCTSSRYVNKWAKALRVAWTRLSRNTHRLPATTSPPKDGG